MNKRIEIKLIDPDLEPGNKAELNYSDCNHILEKYPFEDVTLDKAQDALDLITAYIYKNRFTSIVVDIKARNKYLSPAKEMTLEEIEEKLGHKVKIISEKED